MSASRFNQNLMKKPKWYLQQQYDDPNNSPDLPEEGAAYVKTEINRGEIKKETSMKRKIIITLLIVLVSIPIYFIGDHFDKIAIVKKQADRQAIWDEELAREKATDRVVNEIMQKAADEQLQVLKHWCSGQDIHKLSFVDYQNCDYANHQIAREGVKMGKLSK